MDRMNEEEEEKRQQTIWRVYLISELDEGGPLNYLIMFERDKGDKIWKLKGYFTDHQFDYPPAHCSLHLPSAASSLTDRLPSVAVTRRWRWWCRLSDQRQRQTQLWRSVRGSVKGSVRSSVRSNVRGSGVMVNRIMYTVVEVCMKEDMNSITKER